MGGACESVIAWVWESSAAHTRVLLSGFQGGCALSHSSRSSPSALRNAPLLHGRPPRLEQLTRVPGVGGELLCVHGDYLSKAASSGRFSGSIWGRGAGKAAFRRWHRGRSPPSLPYLKTGAVVRSRQGTSRSPRGCTVKMGATFCG